MACKACADRRRTRLRPGARRAGALLVILIGTATALVVGVPKIRTRWLVSHNAELRRVVSGVPLRDVRELGQVVGLWFPEESRIVRSRYKVWLGEDILAVVEFPGDHLGEFLSRLPLSVQRSTSDRLGIRGDGPSWWRPFEVDQFIAFRLESKDSNGRLAGRGRYRHECLNAVVAVSAGEMIVAYIQWDAE